MTEELLGTLGDRRYRVLQPIPLRHTRTEGLHVYIWEAVDLFGCGRSRQAALRDIQHGVIGLYEGLCVEAESLSPMLQAQWEILRRYCRRIGDTLEE